MIEAIIFFDLRTHPGHVSEPLSLQYVKTPLLNSLSFSEIRTISIDFQKNDSKIQIIGTHVIPEFGTIVMIVLTMGILATILLTKNKFQIKI